MDKITDIKPKVVSFNIKELMERYPCPEVYSDLQSAGISCRETLFHILDVLELIAKNMQPLSRFNIEALPYEFSNKSVNVSFIAKPGTTIGEEEIDLFTKVVEGMFSAFLKETGKKFQSKQETRLNANSFHYFVSKDIKTDINQSFQEKILMNYKINFKEEDLIGKEKLSLKI